MGWWEYWKSPRYFTSQGFELRPPLDFSTFSIIQWKLFQSQQWNGWWWLHYTFTSVFSSKICTLCKGISWQVNLSRLDFPWILRWCYFHSLSAASFWLFSLVSLLFALSSLISSNVKYAACYCKIVKSNTAGRIVSSFLSSCLFHRKVFSGKLNQTLFRSCQKIKKRSGRKSLLDASDERANFQLNNKTIKVWAVVRYNDTLYWVWDSYSPWPTFIHSPETS